MIFSTYCLWYSYMYKVLTGLPFPVPVHMQGKRLTPQNENTPHDLPSNVLSFWFYRCLRLVYVYVYLSASASTDVVTCELCCKIELLVESREYMYIFSARKVLSFHFPSDPRECIYREEIKIRSRLHWKPSPCHWLMSQWWGIREYYEKWDWESHATVDWRSKERSINCNLQSTPLHCSSSIVRVALPLFLIILAVSSI
jgi:hypothetical protein